MASILRIQPASFMEQPRRPDSYERVRWIACGAVADMAHAHGVDRITIDDAYSHMRRLRFKWPGTYALCDEAANRVTIHDEN